MKGYSLFDTILLRVCAPHQLVGAQTFFQTQPHGNPERSEL